MRSLGRVVLLWAGLGAVGWAQPPLSLESAVHTALQQNPRLQSALKDVEQARAQVGAASASLYPSVDVAITNNSASRNTGANNANAVSNGGVVTDVNGNVIAANNNNGSNITSINQLALRVEHILLDFGQRAEAIRAVERLAEAQVAQAGAVSPAAVAWTLDEVLKAAGVPLGKTSTGAGGALGPGGMAAPAGPPPDQQGALPGPGSVVPPDQGISAPNISPT